MMDEYLKQKKMRFSIRKSKKYKGAISVAIACFILFGGFSSHSNVCAEESGVDKLDASAEISLSDTDKESSEEVSNAESETDKVASNSTTDENKATTIESNEVPALNSVTSNPTDVVDRSIQPEDSNDKILTSDYDPENVIKIDEPEDYPILATNNEYNPDKYFIFKSVKDSVLGSTYYFAVNRQQDDGVLFVFDKNGNLIHTQIAGTQKQLEDTIVRNYGDTYTINHPQNVLSYDYSGDGEKEIVAKNAKYNAITGVLPKQSLVTVRYVDENEDDIIEPVHKNALSGEIREIQGPIAIEGYVYQHTSGDTKGSVSIYSSEKINQTWSRHFVYSATNSEIRADYTLLDNQGTFKVDIYRNNVFQKSVTLLPGQYTNYSVSAGWAIDHYSFPNPYIPNSGEVIFHYAKVGKIIPVDEANQPITDAPTPSYHTDPENPESVLPNQATPDIIGYTKTVDSITPVDPTEDTRVVYVKNTQTGTISVRYLDQDNQNQEIAGTGKNIQGNLGDTIDYTTQPTIDELVKKGYELVSDGFTESGKELSEENTGKVYEVILKHGRQTYTPENPGTPGTPINPEDPTGSMTPIGTSYQDLVQAASQTIRYHGAGDQTPANHVSVNETAFTRSVTVDKVTGAIVESSDWQPSKVTFESVSSPSLAGYTVDKPVAGGLEATVSQPNVVDDVVYMISTVDNSNIQRGSVDVSYLDIEGNLLPNTVVEILQNQALVGQTYSVSVREFANYEFLRLADDSAPLQGYVINGDQHVRLIYQKIEDKNMVDPTPTIHLPNTGTDTKPEATPTKTQPTVPNNISQVTPAIPENKVTSIEKVTKQLPKTGVELLNGVWGFVCLILAMGLHFKSKKKND